MAIGEYIKSDELKEAVYKAWELEEDKKEGRGHLGCSEIGDECERRLWLSFRKADKKRFNGRLLRLFNRGTREEAVVHWELQAAGMEVKDTQRNFIAGFGHFGGSCDGIVTGVPGAEATPHILEIKTHSSKSFAKLEKDGVQKAMPKHYAQMQCYMRFAKLTRALYYAINKDTDEIYTERVRENTKEQDRMFEKAERVVFSEAPPDRPYNSPADYRCKLCDMADVCWFYKRPTRNCRNCCAATPDQDGKWECDNGKEFGTPCENHLFIPPVVSDKYEMGSDGCVWHEVDGKRLVDCPDGCFPRVDDGLIPEVLDR